MTVSSGLQYWRTSYEINPIIFVGGIAGVPGGMLPIGTFLGGLSGSVLSNSTTTNLSGNTILNSTQISLDDYFAHFFVLPGAELIVNQFAHYPFLNQTVAANAIITQPLKISLRMVAPVKGTESYYDKLSTMSVLKSTLDQHITLGGTFNVATPSYLYTGCLLESLKDMSSGESDQLQFEWQWDFEQPLLTLAAAAAVQGALMTNMTNMTPTLGDPPQASTSGIPNTNVATATVPTNAPAVAASVQPIPLVTAPPQQ